MNNIKGIIVEISKNNAILLTSTGEFVNVSATRDMHIGEEYNKINGNISFIRKIPKAFIAALFMFTFLGGGLGAYYTPVTTLNLHINPSIQLKTNLFNKVIYSSALNSDGKIILDTITVKNKNYNDALSLIVTESENQKFITEDYKSNKSISLEVTGKNLDVSTFQNNVKDHGISIKVEVNTNKHSIENKKDNKKNSKTESNLLNSNKNPKNLNKDNTKDIRDKNILKNPNINEKKSIPLINKSSIKESNTKQDNIKNKIIDNIKDEKKDKKTNDEKNNNKNIRNKNLKDGFKKENIPKNLKPKNENNNSSNKSLNKEN